MLTQSFACDDWTGTCCAPDFGDQPMVLSYQELHGLPTVLKL